MRVLLVSSHGADRSYGGAERYVDDLATELRGRGHETLVLSGFPVRDSSAERTVTLHHTDWRDDPVRRYRNHVDDWLALPSPRVGELLDELRPDVVHTNNLPGISTGIWTLGRRAGAAVVHTLHDYHLLCPRTSLTRADGSPCHPHPLLCGLRTHRLARWADAVHVAIGVSDFVLARHQAFFGPATERRVIRPPLMPLPDGPAAAPNTPPTVLGYLGALTESKGVAVLLAAAPRLRDAGFTVRIAGDGPLRGAVERSPAVEYIGRVDPADLPAYLTGCDVGLIPSQWEEPGLTYVVFEWLAAGRAVLATRRGGLAEATALGGVMPFDGSADGLVAAALALRRTERWPALIASIPRAAERGDVDRWADAHEEAYRVAVSG